MVYDKNRKSRDESLKIYPCFFIANCLCEKIYSSFVFGKHDHDDGRAAASVCISDDNENFSAFERSGSGIAVGQSKGLCRGSRYKSSSFFTVKIITISDDIMTMTLNAFFLAANCVIIIAAHNFSAQ